ncbi:dTDP-4-dehydrorhamnose 3,5-epimerase [Arenicella xantha]|uniref:dTDP-4-dehydrorhamnose 3,5-epimerase n=1 Tax=Arenicella xantha TaxID=644221 RepID=A0A395JLZ4_9GAMM|nr:dTDP-4-dehydrorhamnose 3,5-epimerase [Arenicella xantha]RBP51619.1 dTDP-4-dehydrorhamnose 3,5-epimerase [Arenicella xantha]
MKVEQTKLEGVLLVTPQVFGDERGFFMETYNREKALANGLPGEFVQDNHSKSSRGVLRGLHYQHPQWQGKLVRTVQGEIFDVAVDIRAGSTTYGEWVGYLLNDENKQQLYVPPGFAHGFVVTSDTAEVVYKCTTVYAPAQEGSVLWNDPDIGIEWPIDSPILSAKDQVGRRLADLPALTV